MPSGNPGLMCKTVYLSCFSTTGADSEQNRHKVEPQQNNLLVRCMVSLTTQSSTKGTVVLENETTGKSVTKTIFSTYTLEGQNAEWIVEDYKENGGQVALAYWGP